MILHQLTGPPSSELAKSLAKFERQFTYPLGPGRSFRIEHGDDYARFFRAMGEAACFVAERDGHVLGVVGAALRPLLLPTGDEARTLYLGDLKIDPGVRGGRTLLTLADAVRTWVGDRVTSAFGVVMDGTPVSPTRYTGRMGIPPFDVVGKILVLRIPGAGAKSQLLDDWIASEEEGLACFKRLSSGRFASLGGNPAERSASKPVWLMRPGGQACGRVEDTRLAKRLLADDGIEMISAHLSAFAYDDVRAGAELLQLARGLAASRNLPALFAAVPASAGDELVENLRGIPVVVAPATVYGAGVTASAEWNVNTAEI